jgi:hypothetical protein
MSELSSSVPREVCKESPLRHEIHISDLLSQMMKNFDEEHVYLNAPYGHFSATPPSVSRSFDSLTSRPKPEDIQ